MPLKLLAIGDLHLGRVPSRLPEDLLSRVSQFGPTGVWHRIVDAAVHNSVHAVLLAGDVVEEATDFFEAYRELFTGVKRLLEQDIRVLAVAGNHDVQVLPRLAEQLDGFTLLGRDGLWDKFTLKSGAEALTVHGWSYPRSVITTSPLENHEFERGPGVNLGLLHCDRDQAASSYAPVSSRELLNSGLEGWLLGHIHVPDSLSPDQPIGYLGSATGLDPGHQGARGPWYIAVEKGNIALMEHWRLAPLQWERLQVDLTGIKAAEDARDRLLDSINELDRSLSAYATPPEAAGIRVTLTGRTRLRDSVEELLSREDLSALYTGSGRIRYFVENLACSIYPELDITQLAKRADPPGILARRLLILERDPADRQRRELLQEARSYLDERANKAYWQALQARSTLQDDEKVAEWLHAAGLAALHRLLAQKEEPG